MFLKVVHRIIIIEFHRIGSLMVKPILIEFTDMSDISKVFEAGDTLTLWGGSGTGIDILIDP